MGNYEIQAKIDIERHPEWNEEKQLWHITLGIMKDNEQARKDNRIIWITSSSWRHAIDTSVYAPYTDGLRSQSFIIDETDWQRQIILPNAFRTEVLGDVRI